MLSDIKVYNELAFSKFKLLKYIILFTIYHLTNQFYELKIQYRKKYNSLLTYKV